MTPDFPLKPLPDDDNGVCQLADAADGHCVVVYPVLYGLRVRAGRRGDGTCELDWCCGADPVALGRAYRAAVTALAARAGEDRPFRDLPGSSRVKPYPLDRAFRRVVDRLVGDAGPWPLPGDREIRERWQAATGAPHWGMAGLLEDLIVKET